jgi:hypothetical protein
MTFKNPTSHLLENTEKASEREMIEREVTHL